MNLKNLGEFCNNPKTLKAYFVEGKNVATVLVPLYIITNSFTKA